MELNSLLILLEAAEYLERRDRGKLLLSLVLLTHILTSVLNFHFIYFTLFTDFYAMYTRSVIAINA